MDSFAQSDLLYLGHVRYIMLKRYTVSPRDFLRCDIFANLELDFEEVCDWLMI